MDIFWTTYWVCSGLALIWAIWYMTHEFCEWLKDECHRRRLEQYHRNMTELHKIFTRQEEE